METHTRSIIKAISWRIIATLTTITIVFMLTGSIELASFAGGMDITIKLVLYFLHERAWTKIKYGYKHYKR